MHHRFLVALCVSSISLAACSENKTAADSQSPDPGSDEYAAADAPMLGAIFTADDAANCDLLTETGRQMLFEESFSYSDEMEMNPVANAPFTVEGLDRQIEPSIILPHPGEDRYEVWISLDGPWLGLTVSAIGYRFMPRTDYPTSVRLYFTEPVETVASTLAEAGFPVNADGSVKRTVLGEDGAMYDYYGLVSFVEEAGTETVFECNEQGWDQGD
jgi:hypothetical protein